jgi:asparagine synthetase B (glutamine-hydrolysing)
MCSIIFSSKPFDSDKANFYTKFRGPDYTNKIEYEGFSFLHNLLSITGTFTPQPLIDDDVVILFNGELYGYDQKFDNDTKAIIPLYKEHGEEFSKYLDGEFAIVLADFKTRRIIIAVDTFKTKPLFYCVENGHIGCASYSTPLKEIGFNDVKKMEPNTALIFDMDSKELIRKCTNYEFDLNQYKKSYDDWNDAFSKSIKKRTLGVREGLFVGMSSGYDSGAIACEMNKNGTKFKIYTKLGVEDRSVLNSRYNILKANAEIFAYDPTDEQINKARNYIENNTEKFYYTIHSSRSDYNEYWLKLIDDNGSKQFSHLCSLAKADNKKIHISGAGADEIFSDYGFNGQSKYKHSNFGGLFPSDLRTMFPWASFYGSTMESYLAKEEYVGGSYGIESRYPFLDKMVVQEFLWLGQELKNNAYKNVLHNYLVENNFPFTVGNKIGF